jgi:hypothetical protein
MEQPALIVLHRLILPMRHRDHAKISRHIKFILYVNSYYFRRQFPRAEAITGRHQVYITYRLQSRYSLLNGQQHSEA